MHSIRTNPHDRVRGDVAWARSLLAAVFALAATSLAHAQLAHPSAVSSLAGEPRPISEPPSPGITMGQVGAWGGACKAFVQVGDIGYLGSGERLVVLDMSDPSSLVELGSVRLRTVVLDVEVQGGYAYVLTKGYPFASGTGPATVDAEWESTFHVVDVSDPTAPFSVWNDRQRSFTDLALPKQIFHYNGLAWILDSGSGNSIMVWDVSDPLDPRPYADSLLSDVQIAQNSVNVLDLPHGYEQFVIDAGYLYGIENLSASDQTLDIYDLSSIDKSTPPGMHTRWAPPLIAQVSFTSQGMMERQDKVLGLVVENGWAYAAAYTVDNTGNDEAPRLWAIDVSDPAKPVLGGSAEIEDSKYYCYSGLAASGGRVYWANINNEACPRDSLMIFDVTADPPQPTQIGSYITRGSVEYGVEAEGDTAYLLDQGEGLIVLDASNPAVPVPLDNYLSPARMKVVVKRGDLAYISDYWNGLSIVDVSDPTNPTLVGAYQTTWGGGMIRGLALDNDGYAYLAGEFTGLNIIDVSDPSNPTAVTTLFYSAQSVSVETDDSGRKIAFLQESLGRGTMRCFDVTDPFSVTQLGSVSNLLHNPNYPALTWESDGSGMLYAGNNSFLRDPSTGNPFSVNAVDVSDPTAPAKVALHGSADPSSNSYSYDVALEKTRDVLWLTRDSDIPVERKKELVAIDVSDPQNSVRLGSKKFDLIGAVTMHPRGIVVVGYGDGTNVLPPPSPEFHQLQLLSVNNWSAPQVLASAPMPSLVIGGNDGSLFSDVFADDSGVYVVADSSGLSVFEVRSALLADVTRRNSVPGDAGFGEPDGTVTAADLSYFLNAWVTQNASVADITTRGATPADPAYGMPDGELTIDDIRIYIIAWLKEQS